MKIHAFFKLLIQPNNSRSIDYNKAKVYRLRLVYRLKTKIWIYQNGGGVGLTSLNLNPYNF